MLIKMLIEEFFNLAEHTMAEIVICIIVGLVVFGSISCWILYKTYDDDDEEDDENDENDAPR